jgi:hypothetical protein
MNLGAYEFRGRVMVAGLNHLTHVFTDINEYHQYVGPVTRIGDIEMDPFDSNGNLFEPVLNPSQSS